TALVETLEDGALEEPEVARRFLDRMHVEVDGLSHLVQELLELSRIESGQVPLRLETVPLGPLLEGACARLQAQAERRGVTLACQTGDGLPPVRGDAARLEQVLANLLQNAIKFTPPGGRVEVWAEAPGPGARGQVAI